MRTRNTVIFFLFIVPSIAFAQTTSIAKEILKQVSINVLTEVLTDAIKSSISTPQQTAPSIGAAPTYKDKEAAKKKILGAAFVDSSSASEARAKLILEKIWNPNRGCEDKHQLLYQKVDFLDRGVITADQLCNWLNTNWRSTYQVSPDKSYAVVSIHKIETSQDTKLTTIKYRLNYLYRQARFGYEHGNNNQIAVIVNMDTNPKIVALKPPGLQGLLW